MKTTLKTNPIVSERDTMLEKRNKEEQELLQEYVKNTYEYNKDSNLERNRYYWLRIGDTVKLWYITNPATKDIIYSVVGMWSDNNRVILKQTDWNLFEAVAEWCNLERKVEDISSWK